MGTSYILPVALWPEHETLANMPLVRKGNRLSIMPVSEEEGNYILDLEEE